MLRRGLQLGLLLLCGATRGWCERYRFHQFGPEDRLSASVSQVLQDRTGYLWVGTASGLFRYDGSVFRQFGISAGLPANCIRALAESPDGALWVLTTDGLARLHDDGFEVVDTGAPARELISLAISPRGQIYLGARHGIFSAPPPAPLARPDFLPITSAPKQAVSAILADADGKTWFACGANLCLLAKSDVRVFNTPAGPWKAILRDHEGVLWLRSAEHVYVLPPRGERFVSRDRNLPASTSATVALIEDREERVWTSTDRGLALWTASGWQIVGTSEGLPADAVTALWQDRQGSLWIGISNAGLARWPRPFEWTNWTTADGLPTATVTALLREGPAHLWVGTANGLVRFGPGNAIHTWNRRSGLAGDRVSALALPPDGSVWVACSPGGITRIAASGTLSATQLKDAHVNALVFDLNERLWVAAEEGVFRSTAPAESLHFERIKPPGSAESAGYAALAADRRGGMWIASAANLLRWEGGSWTQLGAADGLRTATVSSVLSLPDGSLWAAYREPFGLVHLTSSGDGWHASPLTQASGLPSEEIRFLGRDASGQLWAGTDRGIVSGVPGKWRRWSQEDGPLSPDATPHSFFADADGAVWFGTARGLARFTPSHRAIDEDPPQPVIASMHFGDQDFEADVTALNLSGRSDVSLRYRLWGRDAKWIESTSPGVRYTGLPPGRYRFEVQTRIGSGPWSTRSAAVGFRVVPAWWGAWWFAAILAMAAASLFYGALHWCVARLRRQNRRIMRAA
jgi:ligand-binding sensor domain-containing protein